LKRNEGRGGRRKIILKFTVLQGNFGVSYPAMAIIGEKKKSHSELFSLFLLREFRGKHIVNSGREPTAGLDSTWSLVLSVVWISECRFVPRQWAARARREVLWSMNATRQLKRESKQTYQNRRMAMLRNA
jgi:hypothetical protein